MIKNSASSNPNTTETTLCNITDTTQAAIIIPIFFQLNIRYLSIIFTPRDNDMLLRLSDLFYHNACI